MSVCEKKENLQCYISAAMLALCILFAVIPFVKINDISYSVFSGLLGSIRSIKNNQFSSLNSFMMVFMLLAFESAFSAFSLIGLVKRIGDNKKRPSESFDMAYMWSLDKPFAIVISCFLMAARGGKLIFSFYLFLVGVVAWFVSCIAIHFLKPFSPKEKRLLGIKTTYVLLSFFVGVIFMCLLFLSPDDGGTPLLVAKYCSLLLLIFSYPSYIVLTFYDLSCIVKDSPQAVISKLQNFFPIVFFVVYVVGTHSINAVLCFLSVIAIVLFIVGQNLISSTKKNQKMTAEEITRVYLGSPRAGGLKNSSQIEIPRY